MINETLKNDILEIAQNDLDNEMADERDIKVINRFKRKIEIINNFDDMVSPEYVKFFPRFETEDFDTWDGIMSGLAGGWYIDGLRRRQLPTGIVKS